MICLQALMSHICIRRTKEVSIFFLPFSFRNYYRYNASPQMQDAEGNHLVPLPPLEMIVVPVTLDTEARVIQLQLIFERCLTIFPPSGFV